MKAHLLTTEFPIVSGQDQTADCGKEVPKAAIVFMWDEQAMGEGIKYARNICRECYMTDCGVRGPMLVYGISERKAEAE